jgi:hypothetical protein
MRGAILYQAASHLIVVRRIMSASYGIKSTVPFQSDEHPPEREIVSLDGSHRCKGVMAWFVENVFKSTT